MNLLTVHYQWHQTLKLEPAQGGFRVLNQSRTYGCAQQNCLDHWNKLVSGCIWSRFSFFCWNYFSGHFLIKSSCFGIHLFPPDIYLTWRSEWKNRLDFVKQPGLVKWTGKKSLSQIKKKKILSTSFLNVTRDRPHWELIKTINRQSLTVEFEEHNETLQGLIKKNSPRLRGSVIKK